jgi:6-phosphogluconolactonase
MPIVKLWESHLLSRMTFCPRGKTREDWHVDLCRQLYVGRSQRSRQGNYCVPVCAGGQLVEACADVDDVRQSLTAADCPRGTRAVRGEPDGQLAAFGSVGSGGENPVDIGFLAEGRFLVVASYTSGTVGLVRVGPDGAPQDLCQIITLERPGYDAGRPLVSMPHGVAICPEGNFVLIPNKGLDCVFVFRFDPAGQLVPADVPYAACKTGTGPRHAAFHPTLPILYVVGELGCSVQVFHWDAATGALHDEQVVSTLPGVAVGDNLAAEIAVSADGRSVYASNRGHDSIANFRVNERTGLLGPAMCTSCLGKEPRFFALAPNGRSLHVANQESDTITSFPLNEAGEMGAGFVSAHVASPSSICFATQT